jgi:hypothetical protein
MGRCLQIVHTFKQNITGGAAEALAAGSSDSLQIPNFRPDTDAWLIEMWGGNSANAGEFDVRSPDFHDNTRGLRVAAMFNPTLSGADGDPQLLLPSYVRQPLYASDVLTAEVNATATNNVGLAWLTYFENLPGADQNLHRWDEIQSRIVNTLGIRVSVVAGAAGDYGSNRLLNQDDDRLIANTDYAILGATSQLPCCSLAFTAPETSGRRIGLPLHWDARVSGGWFVDVSDKYRIPAIPVVNSNNKGNVIFNAADPGGAIACAATIIMAELR